MDHDVIHKIIQSYDKKVKMGKMVQDCVLTRSSELQFGVSEFRPKSEQSFVRTFLGVSELSSSHPLFGLFEVSEKFESPLVRSFRSFGVTLSNVFKSVDISCQKFSDDSYLDVSPPNVSYLDD